MNSRCFRNIGWVGMVWLLGVVLCGAADEAPPSMTAVKAEGQIKIDGVLDETAWQKAQKICFDQLQGCVCEAPTEALVMYDDDNLYIGVVCRFPAGTEFDLPKRKRDGAVWEDESVEVFLDPGATRRKYFQFIVTPEGSYYDSYDFGGKYDLPATWDGDQKLAVTKGKTEWIMEMAIPLSSLKLKAGMSPDWGINFCRNYRPSLKGKGISCGCNWAKLTGNYHQPDKFGFLRGMAVDYNRYPIGVEFESFEPFFGRGKLRLKVVNAGAPRKTNVLVKFFDEKGAELKQTREEVEIPSGEKEIAVPLEISWVQGRKEMAVVVEDAATGKALESLRRSVSLNGVLKVELENQICWLQEVPTLNIKVVCGEDTRGKLNVSGVLKDARDAECCRISGAKMESERTRIPVRPPDMKQGRYRLEGEIRDGDQMISKFEKTILIVAGPFDEEKNK